MNERLVEVDVKPTGDRLVLEANLIAPPRTFFGLPRWGVYDWTLTPEDTESISQSISIGAGETDANDESHFTIPYTLNGKDGIIDGWLINNGEGIRLVLRSGAASLWVIQ